MDEKAKKRTMPESGLLIFQLKITLQGASPPIWRRIEVEDCTLDELHEHIQTAMGWTNSHLHHFRINNRLYGDPMLMEDDFDCMGYEDSTDTALGDVVPELAKQFRFIYEYDFGDNWEHEIIVEGCPLAEEESCYPRCVEGQRACPPEDVGGVRGYREYLQALADPDDEQHQLCLEWLGPFDPEKFDAAAATKMMQQGLPEPGDEDWL